VKLEELRVYQLAMEMGKVIWEIVQKWDYFSRDTVGKQLVKSVDSIAANLSEGFGRYYFKEGKQFGYYARGSLYEMKTWLTKAHNRSLMNDKDFESIMDDFDLIGKQLNSYIKSIGNQQTTTNNQ
jgi:four helix bundle protein